MYYSSGNYEAFARPKKPEGVDNKSAYIVGSGLAALSAACYLVRDGQMQGEHVHILEKGEMPGGACDGYKFENLGYVMRGGREMDNHFEVMWDLFRSIPSIETEGVSVLDEYYWLNKEDPNYSLCRATEKRGQDAHTDGKFSISDKGAMEIMKLFFTPNEDLQDKKITDFFDDEVLSSNFWLYWRTMFAFENWHSALEMKLYIQRYIHHIGGLPDFTALRFTKYNQYESMIWCSSPTAAAWRTPPWAARTSPPPTTPSCGRAAAGICGARSPRRIPISAIPTSSATIRRRPTG